MGPPRVDGTSALSFYGQGSSQCSTATVQLGETSLGQVANRLGVDPDDLLLANPQIKDPSKLQTGQEIYLPTGSNPTSTAGGTSQPAPQRVSSAASHGSAEARAGVELKLREGKMNTLIGQAANAGMGPADLMHMVTTLSRLPQSEFDKRAGQIGNALNAGDVQGAQRALGLADAALDAVNKAGGGQAIQADVQAHADGIHFDFDRPLTKQQATDLIFQGGKVPPGAQLVQGKGNQWIVQTDQSLEGLQDTVNHFNSHLETVDSAHPGQATYTWVAGRSMKMDPVSHRKDINNDFGFKVTGHYPLDQGQIPVDQVKSAFGTGQGAGYEVQFDKPMTKEEVMDKLFKKDARFSKGDVQLTAVPKEPSTTYQMNIIGIDAATSLKPTYQPAFIDATLNQKPSMTPGIPDGMRKNFDNQRVPPNATKHPPDTYVWEQDGYLAYVHSDGKGNYDYQATKLPDDPASKKTILYFCQEKGMPPREAWKAFTDHWDDINRQMIAAFAFTLAAAGGMPGRDPSAGLDGAISPRISGQIGKDVESDVGNDARVAGVGGESPVVRGGPLDDTVPLPGNVRQNRPTPPPHDPTPPPVGGGRGRPLDDTAQVDTVESSAGSPGGAQGAGTGKTGEIDPSIRPPDNAVVKVNTPSGPKEMTAGQYRARVKDAKQWISGKMQEYHSQVGSQKGALPPNYRALQKEAAEKFGIDENWESIGNPIVYGKL